MDKETAKAWAEQQAREIKNLKAMKRSEKNRILKIIEDINIWQPDYRFVCFDREELMARLNSQNKPFTNRKVFKLKQTKKEVENGTK